MRFPKIFLLILLTLLLGLNLPSTQPRRSHAADDRVATTSQAAQENRAKWTFLVYIATDNNLEGFAISNIDQMEFVGSTTEVNVVVQLDRAADYDTSNGDWTEARRYYVTQDTQLNLLASEEVMNLGEIDTGDPAQLEDFLAWGISTYPAEHYALVIAGHGSAWRGTAFDDSSIQSSLKPATMSVAISNALQKSGVAKLDLIGFDACLMASIEVYQNLAPYAHYGVASPELIPGQGWNYLDLLDQLTLDPEMSAETLGIAVVDTFYRQYSEYIDSYTFYNIGLVNLEYIAPVTSTLQALTNLINRSPIPVLEEVLTARNAALVFPSMDDPTSSDRWSAVDMFSLLEKLAESDTPELAAAAQNVLSSAENFLVYYLNSDTLLESRAVSLYFPRSRNVFETNESTNSYQATHFDFWAGLLRTFYNAFSGFSPEITLGDTLVDANGNLSADVAFTGQGLSQALFYILMRVDNGSPILVEYQRLTADETTTNQTITWARRIPVVADGQTEIPALLILSRHDPELGIVHGTYYPQDGAPTPARLVINVATGLHTSVWGMQATPDGLVPYEIQPAVGDQFEPLWLSLDNEGNFSSRQSGRRLTFGTTPIRFYYIYPPEGSTSSGIAGISIPYQVQMGVSLENVAGNFDVSTESVILTETVVQQPTFEPEPTIIASTPFPTAIPADTASSEVAAAPTVVAALPQEIIYASNPAPGSTINLGGTSLGSSFNASPLTISNDGGLPLDVNLVQFIGAPNMNLIAPAFPITINPGDPDVTVTFSCTPSAVGTFIGTLHLSTNDPDLPSGATYQVECVGNATPGAVFGSTPAGTGPVTLGGQFVGGSVNSGPVLTLSNNGTAPLYINTSGVNSLNASVITPTFPQTIAPSSSIQVSFLLHPTRLGPEDTADTITFVTDDAGTPSVTFQLDFNATNVVINTVADSADGTTCNHTYCDLRNAIRVINDAGNAFGTQTITRAGTLSGTITLTHGELTINQPMQIFGASAITVNGNNASRILNNTGGNVLLVGLTLTGGNSTGNGGAILNSGSLSMQTVTVNNSVAGNHGGGIFNSGTVNLSNTSIISGNTASLSGGGIFNTGTVSVTNSSINSNIASLGFGGGIYSDTGTIFLTSATLLSNTANVSGGGVYRLGAALVVDTATTIGGNTAVTGDGGGIKGTPYVGGPPNYAPINTPNNEAP